MISFRFHLISIVAVFLALGLGVLAGTTVLDQGIVSQLEDRTDQLAAQADQLRRRVGELEAAADAWDEFGDAVTAPLVGGRLEDVVVVLVTQEGTDRETLDEVRRTLGAAQAEIGTEIVVGSRMALPDSEARADLADVVGETADEETLTEEAAHRLADELSFGAGGIEVLEDLALAGFLSRDGASPVPVANDGPGQPDRVVLVVAGAPGDPIVEPSSFLVPLVGRLVANGQAVAAAEMTESGYPFVTTLRGTAAAERMVTQDNANRAPGGIGLVLATEDLLEEGLSGHYGVKSGAAGLLPPLS